MRIIPESRADIRIYVKVDEIAFLRLIKDFIKLGCYLSRDVAGRSERNVKRDFKLM